MLLSIPYNRRRAVDYARRWALNRNPLFIDFTGQGGNCTNFVSQCIYAGAPVMNYTPTFGWYYISAEDRAPAWSGVDELYDFLTGAPDFSSVNGGSGPYATDLRSSGNIDIGDVIQLAREDGSFYHSLIISGFNDSDVLVCAQSDDALDRPLSTYNYASLRAIHIEGAMIYFNDDQRFMDIFDAKALPS